MDVGELVLLAVLAAVWWVPAFVCINDLQGREGVRRVLVWKWSAVLCVPTLGAVAYWYRGRDELDADVRSRRDVASRRGGAARARPGQRRRPPARRR